MRALVLLGGQGTRLRPLTYEIPKPMLPVVDRPMIFQIVEWLSLHGVTKVVFALGYHSAAFLDAFREGSYAGVEVVTATEPSPLDTAGAIAFASDVAGVAGERLIVNACGDRLGQVHGVPDSFSSMAWTATLTPAG